MRLARFGFRFDGAKLAAAATQLISIAVISLCGAAILQAFWVPVYTDEVVWKTQQYRYVQDGFTSYHGLVQCPQQFGHDLPLALRPAAAALSGYYAITYGWLSPIIYRVLGHLSFLFGWFFFYLLLRKAAPGFNRLMAAAIATLPVSFGLMPLIAIINRPEQEFWVAILLCALAALYREKLLRWNDTLKAIIFILAAAILFQIHPQGILIFPMFAIAAYYALRKWSFRVLVISAFLALTVVHGRYWTERIKCPESPIAEATLAIERTRIPSWGQFVELFLASQQYSPFQEKSAVGPAGFAEYVPSQWLAAYPLAHQYAWVNIATSDWLLLMIAMSAIGGVLCCYETAGAFFTGRRPTVEFVVASGFFSLAAAYFVLIPNRNFYRAPLLSELWFAPFILSLGALETRSHIFIRLYRKVSFVVIVFGFVIVLISMCLLQVRATEILPGFGSEAFLSTQSHSFNPLGVSANRDKFVQAAQSCGWDEKKTYRYVVSDELGHQVMRNVINPIFNVYVSEWRFAGGDPIQMMTAVGVEGLLGDCRIFANLPEIHRALKITDGYCCAGFGDREFLSRLRTWSGGLQPDKQ